MQQEQTPSEAKLQLALFDYRNGKHKSIVPNAYLYKWESDAVSVDKERRVHEFEIKISRSDFRADFKKVRKHKVMSAKSSSAKRPNFFWYVCPRGMIKVDEVPEYAGLIYVDLLAGGKTRCIQAKKAPLIHKNPLKDNEYIYLLNKCMYRLWDYKR